MGRLVYILQYITMTVMHGSVNYDSCDNLIRAMNDMVLCVYITRFENLYIG